ncbi:MAG: hypothetical protein HY751_11675 [Nitrospinae bacterium]|nr:hypothetical protein [Nitrospinota bacterium]
MSDRGFKAQLGRLLAVAAFCLTPALIYSCSNDPAKGTTTSDSWAADPDVQTASSTGGTGAQNATLLSAMFSPSALHASGTASLDIYVSSMTAGLSISYVRVAMPDGSTDNIQLATAPSVPGWTTVTFRAPSSGGTYNYTVSLVLSDGSVSNQVTTSLTVTSSPAEGALISDAMFTPSPVTLDGALGYVSDTLTLNIYINSVDSNFQIMEARGDCSSLGVTFTAAILAQPTVPGWFTVATSLGAAATRTGTHSCTVWLVLNDGVMYPSATTTMSNVLVASFSVVQ